MSEFLIQFLIQFKITLILIIASPIRVIFFFFNLFSPKDSAMQGTNQGNLPLYPRDSIGGRSLLNRGKMQENHKQ